MPVTLPLEVYEALEKGLGKEDARKVVHCLEATISEATEYKWKVTKDELLDAIRKEFVTKELFEEKINAFRVDFKDELLSAIRKEFVTKELFEEKISLLRAEMLGIRTDLEGKIENLRTDLEGKIENLRTDLEGKIENLRTDLEGKIGIVKADIKRLDMKLNFMIVLMIIALTLMNPVMAEIIKGILNLK